MAAAARAIRTPVKNRVDNELLHAPVAIPRRRRYCASETVFALTLITVLTVAARQPRRRCARAASDQRATLTVGDL
jgi:hypothetical protein